MSRAEKFAITGMGVIAAVTLFILTCHELWGK